MFRKKLSLAFITLMSLSSAEYTHTNDYDVKDYVEIFALGAEGIKNIALTVRLLKDMTTDDLDRALHNMNNITWDLVIPVIVGAYAAKNYHTGSSTAVKFATGTGSAVGAGLAAYMIGSVPKEIINKLISKATGIKYAIEDSIA